SFSRDWSSDVCSADLPRVKTSLSNVYILNSAQIANGTLNVNETVGVVHQNFSELAAYVRSGRDARSGHDIDKEEIREESVGQSRSEERRVGKGGDRCS